MAFFEDLVSKAGASQKPGEPKQPPVGGAPPAASKPAQIQNPPSVANGPVGRPSSPPLPFAGSAGPALPTAQAARPATPPSQGAGTPAAQPQTIQPVAQPAAQPQAIQPAFSLQLDHVPSRAEMADVPPGVKVTTPYGDMGTDGQLQLNEQGRAAYQQAVLKKQREFGFHPYAGDPNAPPPPIRLGRASINPFTGKWIKG